MFTPKVYLISGGSAERQFLQDVYVSLARTALRSPFPTLPQVSAPLWSAVVKQLYFASVTISTQARRVKTQKDPRVFHTFVLGISYYFSGQPTPPQHFGPSSRIHNLWIFLS